MSKGILSKENCIKHFNWGKKCEGWTFIDQSEVLIEQILIPGKTSEKLHYHEYAQQFFFILKGSATFIVEGEEFKVSKEQAFHIEPGKKHKVSNDTSTDLEFILFSSPVNKYDTIRCE